MTRRGLWTVAACSTALATVIGAGPLAAVSGASPSAAVAGQTDGSAPDLFVSTDRDSLSGVAEETLAKVSRAPGVKRANVLRINDSAIRSICEAAHGTVGSVVVPLFPDAVLTAQGFLLRPSDQGRQVEWRATVAGQDQSSIAFILGLGCAYEQGEGIVTDSARTTAGQLFTVGSAGPGFVVVAEQVGAGAGGNDEVPLPPAPDRPPRPDVPGMETLPKIIDLLALYTPAAAADNGGKRGVQAHLAAEVGDLNAAFANSGVDARVRLVRTEQTDYTGNDVRWALGQLWSSKDGVMDNAHKLREVYGADLVTLDVGREVSGDALGVGYLPQPPTINTDYTGFTVVGGPPASHVLAHEIGHNLGLNHDWATTGYKNFNSNYPFNHGKVSPTKRWHTIMAYSSQCDYCLGIPYFSNPHIVYRGEAIGDRGGSLPADNARMLNLFSAAVANYRPTSVPLEVFPMNVEAGPGGTARAAFPGPYFPGTKVMVSADPAPGHEFSGWVFNGRPYGNSRTVRVELTAASTIRANFTRISADLRISGKVSKIRRGKKLAYRVTVKNTGPYKATGIVVTGTVPGALKSRKVTGTGCGRTGFGVKCRIGTLAARQQRVVVLKGVLGKKAKGTLRFTASARSTSYDPTVNKYLRTSKLAKMKQKKRR